MEKIKVEISELQSSEKNAANLLLKGHGKWVIIPNASHLLDNPNHWEVELEITKELDSVRFAQVAKVIQLPTEDERQIANMRSMIAPLEEEFGKIHFLPIWVERRKREVWHSRGGIFSSGGGGGVLDVALRRSWEADVVATRCQKYEFAKDLVLNMEVARRIWQRNVEVQAERSRLLARAVRIFKRHRSEFFKANRKIRGRYFGGSVTFPTRPLESHPRIAGFYLEPPLDRGFLEGEETDPSFPWSDEGVESYKKHLQSLVQKEKEKVQRGLAAWLKEMMAMAKSQDWILGEHELIYGWVAFHDGMGMSGGRSENNIASSGCNVKTVKAFIKRDLIEYHPSAGAKGVVELRDEEYEFLSRKYLDPKNVLLKEWLVAKRARKEELYKEEIERSLAEPKEASRWQVIRRRCREGWVIVRRSKDGIVGSIDSISHHRCRAVLANPEEMYIGQYQIVRFASLGRSSKWMQSAWFAPRGTFISITEEEVEMIKETTEPFTL